MKSNKKSIIFISALMLAIGFGFGANYNNIVNNDDAVISADDAIFEGLTYVVKNGEITITGYTEDFEFTDVVIPDEIDGKPVTKIGKNAFYLSSIKSITLSNNVTTIEDSAFKHNSYLSKINLGRNVTYIGDSAFSYIPLSVEITLSDNIEFISENALTDTTVSKLIIPATVESIPDSLCTSDSIDTFSVDKNNLVYSSDDDGTLYDKEKYTLIKFSQTACVSSFTTPENTIIIAKSAFENNKWIKQINLSNVVNIEESAFENCIQLSEVDLGKNVLNIGKRAFARTPSLSKLTLSNKIKSIGNEAFYDTEYSQLVVPATVEQIPAELYNQYTLEKIIVDAENKVYTSDDLGVLYSKDKSELIKFPTCNTALDYTTPESTLTIKDSAFKNNDNITKIVLTNVTTVEDSAFEECSRLSKIDLGKNVSYIGNSAFAQTLSLSELTLSDNIEFVGDNVLLNSSYSKLIVPATVENIPETFYSKNTLANISVDTQNKIYSSDEKGVLYNKDKSELIKYPSAIKLDKYTIANTTKTIKTSAFNTAEMATLVIPQSVTTIEKNAINSPKLKTIEGYTGSYAQTFATENKYNFVSLDKSEDKLNYDVDGNGSINVMDLLKLKKYLLG